MRFKRIIFILLLLVAGMFLLNLNNGNAEVSLFDLFQSETAYYLIINYRLPKAIAAILAGVSLSVSGLLLQELFRNPLADPSVLGITSASGLGVALVIFLSGLLGWGGLLDDSWFLCFASFLGAMAALILLMFFSSKLNSTTALIIVGMMIAGLSSAIIGVMQFFAPSDKIKTYLVWTFGSITGLSWNQIFVFFSTVLIGLTISIFALRGISGLRLGESYAQSMGIHIRKLRWIILISTALLTASATAFVGPVAFIGLAVPHLCRMIFKEFQIVRLYILVFFLGIIIMLFFSWLSQLFPNGNLPINIITPLVGAPVVMSILLNRSKFQWNE